MDTNTTVAVVGVAGGAGATRLSVETAATLARSGREVAVLDVAFGTQGLARHVAGEVDPDATRVILEDDLELADGMVDLPLEVPGRVAVLPANAPFERLARAQTAGAARAFEELLADASAAFDVVLVDTPPVATNQAVAAVTTADRVGLIAPATDRGVDAVQRVRARLADVGTAADAVVVNRAGADHPVGGADAAVPESDATAAGQAPAVLDPDTSFAPAVARAAEALVGVELDLEFEERGLLDDVLGR